MDRSEIMVIPDISDRTPTSSESAFSPPEKFGGVINEEILRRLPVASVADRMIALVLDFLIFSPVISLFVAGFLKQTRTFFLLSNSSQEALVAAFILVGLVAVLSVFLQAVFVYFWQATPGQLFLQLRVVSFPQSQARLTLNQCFVRSFFWVLGFFVLALPFLEILSHPLRRAFHERASDTFVLSLKKEADMGPHPVESRFMGSWLRMSFLLIFLFIAMGFLQTYRRLLAGDYKNINGTQIAATCEEMDKSHLKGLERLDAAMTLFLLEGLGGECLDKEADLVLWSDTPDNSTWAYFAKFLLAEGAEKEKYFSKICEDENVGACSMAKYVEGTEKLESLSAEDLKLKTAQFLQSEQEFSAGKYLASLQWIEKLQGQEVIAAAIEKKYVRSVWALKEDSTSEALSRQTSDRSPASVSDGSDDKADVSKEKILEKFKERYEVP